MKSSWIECVVGWAFVAIACGAVADDVRSVASDPSSNRAPQPSEWVTSQAVLEPAVWTPAGITSPEIPIDKYLGALIGSDATVLPDKASLQSDTAGGCGPECDFCWIGTSNENNCPPSYEGDGDCDCGCQFSDSVDCGGGGGCGPECDFCWIGTPRENDCDPTWEVDGDCDCGCQFSDSVDCTGGGGTPDLMVSSSGLSPTTGLNPGESLSILATVHNQGGASAGSLFRIGWYISLDGNVNSSDAAWAVADIPCCLGSGQSVDRNGPFPWPTVAPFITPGATYFVALMADDLSDVGESNEANNWGQTFSITLAADDSCCQPTLSPGDRVRLLVDSPDGAVNLSSGHCGTVVCCDSNNQLDPMLVSWDHWADGHNEDGPCPAGPISYPDSSGWWLGCANVELDPSCGPCPPPDAATDPVPGDGARGLPVDTQLCWNGAGRGEKLIYGQDDRLDVYEVANPGLLAATDATVGLVDRLQLTNNGNGTYSLRGGFSFADWAIAAAGVPLCPGEPYANQPLEAFCSGTLVGPDLILTAGHCILDAVECSQTAFVFGFEMADSSTPILTYPASDVYFCQSIVDREQNPAAADWGVIKVDRPVIGHDPLSVRRLGTVPLGNPLTMIGHPIGLPTKIAGGATVRDNSPSAFFQANVDSYGGNSGSAVLDSSSLTIEGVLVRGNEDFVLGTCLQSNQCSDAGCPGWEHVTRATEFQHLIPAVQGVEYMVFFEDCDGVSGALTGAADGTCFTPPPMDPGTEYCWHVVAKSACGETVGPTWRFTTEGDLSVVSTDPPNCAIDARQPSEPDGSNPAGWNTIDIAFDGDAGVVAMGDFSVSTPGVSFPPTVQGIAHIVPANTVRLLLSRRISLMRWTCVTYLPTGQQTCFGHLPGDVQNNGVSTAGDILSVIDNLNGQVTPPHEDWQCDIDRSGQCGAGDILRVIDLLNGADQYDVWLGIRLDACPTAP